MLGKLKNNSLLSGSTSYLVTNLLNAAIPFALLPVLTRYLSQTEYGEVSIFQTLIGALGAFIGLSVQGAAGRKYYDSDLSAQELKYYIGNCFLVLAATTAWVLSFVFVFRREISAWLNIETQWLLLSIFVSSATFVIATRMGQWQIRKQARKFGMFQISQSLLNMLLSLLFVVYFLQGAAGRIFVLAGTPLVFALVALYFLYKDDLLGFAWRPTYLREILGFGLPLIPHSAGAILLISVDRFIINDKLGLAQVGIYMVGVQIVSVMGLVFDAINNAYVPWLFERLKRNQMEEKVKIVRWTYAYFFILLGVVLLAFVIAPPLLILIVGEKYRATTDIIGWLALGQAFSGMYLMVTNYIFYSKRTALLSLSTISAGLIYVGLLFYLINIMGLKGASVAFAISMGLKFLMTWFVANLRHPMPWFNSKILNRSC